MNLPILYYRFGWKSAKLNGPWAVRTWIVAWGNQAPVTMRFDWYMPTFGLALNHWLISAGLKQED